MRATELKRGGRSVTSHWSPRTVHHPSIAPTDGAIAPTATIDAVPLEAHLPRSSQDGVVATLKSDASSKAEEEGTLITMPLRGSSLSHSPAVLGLVIFGLLAGFVLLQAEVGAFAKAVRPHGLHAPDGTRARFARNDHFTFFGMEYLPPSRPSWNIRREPCARPRPSSITSRLRRTMRK